MEDDDKSTDINLNNTSIKQSDKKNHLDFSIQPKRWWEKKLEGRKLAVMWFFSTVLGVLFISFTSGTFRLLIPIIILFIYAWYGYRYVESAGEFVTLRQARVGQLADSLYFLGFLWTLYALIDSFVIQSHKISLTEAGFRAFGYALVTTATGMFLRLLLMQFGYSEEEQIRLAKKNVEEEIAQFADKLTIGIQSIKEFEGKISFLNKSLEIFKDYIDDIRNHMFDLKLGFVKLHSESLTRIEEHTKETINNFIREFNFNETKETLDKKLKETSVILQETVFRTIQSIENAINIFSNDALKQFNKFSSNLEDISTQITKIRVAPDLVESIVKKNVNEISIELLKSSRIFETTLKRLSEQMRSINIPQDIVEKTISQHLSDALSKFTEGIVEFQGSISKLSLQIRDVCIPSDVVEKLVKEEVQNATANLVKGINSLNEAIKNLEQSVENVTNKLLFVRKKRWWNFWRIRIRI